MLQPLRHPTLSQRSIWVFQCGPKEFTEKSQASNSAFWGKRQIIITKSTCEENNQSSFSGGMKKKMLVRMRLLPYDLWWLGSKQSPHLKQVKKDRHLSYISYHHSVCNFSHHQKYQILIFLLCCKTLGVELVLLPKFSWKVFILGLKYWVCHWVAFENWLQAKMGSQSHVLLKTQRTKIWDKELQPLPVVTNHCWSRVL